jgi:hypothetical protein
MVRKAVDNGAVEIRKVDTLANWTGIFTKPLVGPIFLEHRAAVLGLRKTSMAPPVRDDADCLPHQPALVNTPNLSP